LFVYKRLYVNKMQKRKKRKMFVFLYGILLFILPSVNSHSVKLKSLHAVTRDKVICIEIAKMVDFNYTAWVERINLTVSLEYYTNNTLEIPLHFIQNCLTDTSRDTKNTTHSNFICGKYQDPLNSTENLDLYKSLKLNSLQGRIHVRLEDTFGNVTEVSIDEFELPDHKMSVVTHLHGHDPCRYKAKSDQMCPEKCKPLCELYATGYGKYVCDNKAKHYRKDVLHDLELSRERIDLRVDKLHMDRQGKMICVQAKTDIRSSCYAKYTMPSLEFVNIRKKQMKPLAVRPVCKTMFFTMGYPGTFCFKSNTTSWNEFKSFTPNLLVLHNLTLYCDHFSLFTSKKSINLFGEDIQKYNLIVTYDICPHALKEKGDGDEAKSYVLKDGYLIETVVTAEGINNMTVLIVVCSILFVLIVTLLLFFILHLRKDHK
jgi:hypothetical protein